MTEQRRPLTADDMMTMDFNRELTDKEMVEVWRSQGPLLYADPNGYFDIRSGDVFRAETVKGGHNYVVALRVFNGYFYYGHGDKVKKVEFDNFVKAVEHGDLEFIPMDELDKERLSMAVIGLDAIANRRSAAQSIDIMAESAEEFRQKSNSAMLNL